MNIHFIGIGGIGLSALARFLKYDGHTISGSDSKQSTITKQLQKEGISINIPHDKEFVKNQDIIIHSVAIKQDNQEIQEGKKRGIKILPRKEALKLVLKNKKNYCVCGAHGKSTTTAILASILQCSALIGAISKEFNSNFKYKDNLMAFEADESDGSFLLSNPYCAIVTNAEPEHMEYYDYDLDKFYGAYLQFLQKAKLRVINAEDKFLSSLDINATKLYPSKDIKNLSYFIKNDEPYTSFELKDLGVFEVWGFGYHIAIDASLAILSALNELDIKTVKTNLAKYKGIKKRFDILLNKKDFIVIDDYAHHPTEIKATIKSALLYSKLTNIKGITIIWQPHKYSRLLDNFEAFKECFLGCEQLIILPVWNVGEKAIKIDFEKEFAKYSPIMAQRVKQQNNNILIIKNNKTIKTLDSGIILGVGAGDITYQLRAN